MSDYRALYRKWRPVDFDDVYGQKGITDILKYEVANDKVSHAYLFCGSRGTGKTSCAKILAKAVNCENPKNGNPCNACAACRSIDAGIATDVIEMDAASNNGVGNVRDMKDEIAFTPALLKYRVYIIDEVHMMSGSAFNALLKTLEEPPAYVVFILATTEFNKLPTTIVSRCQRFDFRRIASDVLMARLFKISAAEGIDLTEDGARMIARAAQGGMRDAVSLLELCAGARRKIDAPLVAETVGSGNRETAYTVASAVAASDFGKVFSILSDVVMTGSDISSFWQDLIEAYRDIMVVRSIPDAKNYLDLTDVEYEKLSAIAGQFTMAKLVYHTSLLESSLEDMQRVVEAKRSVAEITLTRMCDPKLGAGIEALAERVEDLEREVSRLKFGGVPARTQSEVPPSPEEKTAPASEKAPEKKAPVKENAAPERKAEPQKTESPVESDASPVPYSGWGAVLKKIKEVKTSLYSQLAKATVLKNPDGSFTVKVAPFFVRIISASHENTALMRGIFAEREKVDPASLSIEITAQEANDAATFSEEIERALQEE